MARKTFTAEKACGEIGKMISQGRATSASDAVRQRPELQPGMTYFNGDSPSPSSSGSGPALLER